MNQAFLPSQVRHYMDQNHPGVPYKASLDGVIVNQPVSTSWGGGVALDFRGLVIKYEPAGTRLKKADGSWASDDIAAESKSLDRLIDQGYVAQFAVGFDELGQLIDSYLEGSEGRDDA